MVNPRAGYETDLTLTAAGPAERIRVAVVGAGPAGLGFAVAAAERGHDVTIYDGSAEIGGQFNLAKRVPGKEEFQGTLDYFGRAMAKLGVTVELGVWATPEMLINKGFDRVVVATGVIPRTPGIDGISHSKVVSYYDVLAHGAKVGGRVAIIGCGGIGFDVAEFVAHQRPSDSKTLADPDSPSRSPEVYRQLWGIDADSVGGLAPAGRPEKEPLRQIYMLQRKGGKPGAGLGRTTGWIHRDAARVAGVQFFNNVSYKQISDAGLTFSEGKSGQEHTLDVDTIITCAGQEPLCELADPLREAGIPTFVIGGAFEAGELDAKRAINQGVRLAAKIESAVEGESLEPPKTLAEHGFEFAMRVKASFG